MPILLRAKMAGRTQRAFADALGVSPALLSLLLRGKYSLGSSAARRILAHYPELRPLLADAVLEAASTATGMREIA